MTPHTSACCDTTSACHRCLNADACAGGVDTLQPSQADQLDVAAYKSSQCTAGYTGNLCAICADSYGTVKPFQCRACMKPSIVVTLYALAAVVMLVAVRVLSSFALAASGPGAVSDASARPVDVLKPLVMYAQYIYVVTNLNGVPWPPTVLVPMQALGWFWSSASGNSLGLDCLLPRHTAIPVAAQRVLFGLLVPLAILSVLMCLEVAARLLCPARWRRHQKRGRFMSLLLCMAFLFLPTWSHSVLSLFACVPLDVPASFPYAAEAVGSFWAQDMTQTCYEGYHRAWALGLGVPLLVLLCFVLPAGLLLFLWSSRRHGRLDDGNFRQQYGFLYACWRTEVCWYEVVVILQTLVLVMLWTFGYVLGAYYQSLVMCAALGIILILLMSVQPHRSAVAGTVSLRSVGVLLTTAFAALTFLPYRNITPAPGYTMAMGAFVLAINTAFVVTTVWRVIALIQWPLLMHCVAGRCVRVAPSCAACCMLPQLPGGLPQTLPFAEVRPPISLLDSEFCESRLRPPPESRAPQLCEPVHKAAPGWLRPEDA